MDAMKETNRPSREELIRLLEERDESQVAELIELLKESNLSLDQGHKQDTAADRFSDKIASFAGSWPFIIIFLILLIGWIVFNTFSLYKVDPFPFILLNLILSTVAAIQASLILMSQNREEERNKEQARSNFYINVKSELLLEDLHTSLRHLRKENQELRKYIEELALVNSSFQKGIDIVEDIQKPKEKRDSIR